MTQGLESSNRLRLFEKPLVAPLQAAPQCFIANGLLVFGRERIAALKVANGVLPQSQHFCELGLRHFENLGADEFATAHAIRLIRFSDLCNIIFFTLRFSLRLADAINSPGRG